MARGVNRVILVGTAGGDAELRTTAGGSAITTVSLATNETWKDKHTGESKERTEWHRVKFFGRLAEIAAEYIKKGKQVYVEGSLRTEKYTDKQQIERYSTDIIASELQLLGGGDRTNASEGSRTQGAARASAPAREPVPAGFEEDDENIPF